MPARPAHAPSPHCCCSDGGCFDTIRSIRRSGRGSIPNGKWAGKGARTKDPRPAMTPAPPSFQPSAARPPDPNVAAPARIDRGRGCRDRWLDMGRVGRGRLDPGAVGRGACRLPACACLVAAGTGAQSSRPPLPLARPAATVVPKQNSTRNPPTQSPRPAAPAQVGLGGRLGRQMGRKAPRAVPGGARSPPSKQPPRSNVRHWAAGSGVNAARPNDARLRPSCPPICTRFARSGTRGPSPRKGQPGARERNSQMQRMPQQKNANRRENRTKTIEKHTHKIALLPLSRDGHAPPKFKSTSSSRTRRTAAQRVTDLAYELDATP